MILHYPIQYIKIAALDCCQIIILSIYVPSTHAYTHVLRLSLDLPYEKRFFVLPSTGFEPTPLLHCSTICLALRPAP
jgi:hypothetical protein